MFAMYQAMRQHCSELGCKELDDLDLSGSKTRRFNQLIETLKTIESVT